MVETFHTKGVPRIKEAHRIVCRWSEGIMDHETEDRGIIGQSWIFLKHYYGKVSKIFAAS